VAEHGERKLAAILAADVVGYSRLAGADEDRILARLRTLRSDLIDPTIAVHHGRVVKRTGDGILVEFRSVVDAVRCAIEMQNGMAERNTGLPPERQIQFRCGVHLGDVVEESDGDLMGDGVNIAARLEGVAKPGTIYLSEDAYRQVKSRLDLAVSDLGATRLKNIAEPVRVYSLQVGKPAAKPPAKKRAMSVLLAVAAVVLLIAIAGGAWYFFGFTRTESVAETAPTPAARLSIIVLPFANLSGDQTQNYFAEGITENLTTALSRVRGSFVIARSTAMTYAGKNVDAKDIGKTLGVRYVLEGSVQRDGHHVRVTAQLIRTDKGDQLWADSFDADIADLFKLQDDIVARLSRALSIELVQAESRRGATGQNPDAVDLSMRGWSIMYRTPLRENDAEARNLFQQAAAVDPKNADAVAGLAYVDLRDQVNAWTEPGVDKQKRGMATIERAIALDPDYAYAYYIKADFLNLIQRPNDTQVGNEALAAAETALRLNPSFAPGYYMTANIHETLGHYDQAISFLRQAIRLSPRDYLMGPWLMHVGRNHFGLRQYDAAIQDELHAIDIGYHTFQPYIDLAAAYEASGDTEKAKQTVADALKSNPKISIAWLEAHLPNLIDWPPGLLPALRKAGLPEK